MHCRQSPDSQDYSATGTASAADAMAVETASLDEEARLRVGIKEDVTRILAAALARAKTTPLRPPPYDIGPQAG